MKELASYGTGEGRGMFLILVEPMALEKAGCMQNPPIFPSPHFIFPVCCCWSHSRFKFPEGRRLMLMCLWMDSCPQHLA